MIVAQSALPASTRSPDFEALFRNTFEQAAIGISHVSPTGKWLRVNRKLCDIVGYTREELLQLTFQDITHADDLDADLLLMRQLVSGAINTYTLEKRYIRKNQTPVWIRLTVSLVRAESGAPDYFIAVIEDIHQQKDAEIALRQQQAQMLHMCNQIDTGLITASLEGDVLYWNKAALAMHEIPDMEYVVRHLVSFTELYELRNLDGSVLPFKDWPLVRIIGGETLQGEELEVVRRDIAWRRRFTFRGSIARDALGTPVVAMLMINDVTEQRRNEARLRQGAALFGTLTEGTMLLDLKGEIIAASNGMTELTGFTEAQLLGGDLSVLQPLAEGWDPLPSFWQSLRRRGGWQGNVLLRHRNGDARVYHVSFKPSPDPENPAFMYYVARIVPTVSPLSTLSAPG